MTITNEHKYVFYLDLFYFVKGRDNETTVIKESKFWTKIRNINTCCVQCINILRIIMFRVVLKNLYITHFAILRRALI